MEPRPRLPHIPVTLLVTDPYLYPSPPPPTKVPHLYDLLAGLLDWDPNARFAGGGQGGKIHALRADPYWGTPDWELISQRRMLSPLQGYVAKKIAAAEAATAAMAAEEEVDPSSASLRGSIYRAKETEGLVKQYAASQAVQAKIEAAHASGDVLPKDVEELCTKESEMDVEGWEFTSQVRKCSISLAPTPRAKGGERAQQRRR